MTDCGAETGQYARKPDQLADRPVIASENLINPETVSDRPAHSATPPAPRPAPGTRHPAPPEAGYSTGARVASDVAAALPARRVARVTKCSATNDIVGIVPASITNT